MSPTPGPDQRAATRQPASLSRLRVQLRGRGLRWTPQRQALIELLLAADGHLTGAELVERSRARYPDTTPSTVYRTLDVLEAVGLIRHSHGFRMNLSHLTIVGRCASCPKPADGPGSPTVLQP